MPPSDSAPALQRFLAEHRIDIGIATLAEFVGALVDFYQKVAFSGLAPIAEADMLLFQFGIYDWGHGEYFEFDITRQFIVDDEEDDDAISQLHCTARYEPSVLLRAVGRGDRWCKSRDGLAEFKSHIEASPAYLAALPLSAKGTQITWGPV